MLGKSVRKRNAAPSPLTALDPRAIKMSMPWSAICFRTAPKRDSFVFSERNMMKSFSAAGYPLQFTISELLQKAAFAN
jgi:hypothetical protein